MIKFNISNLHCATKFPTVEGCIAKRSVDPAEYGMAFDSLFEDFICMFANEVTPGVIIGYLTHVLTTQRESGEIRTITIEKQTINVNTISQDDLEKIVNKLVEEKLMEQEKNK